MSFTERQCDAMDARRDEQKERTVEKRLTRIPTLPNAQTPASIIAVELMRLFDSLTALHYSSMCLFEHHTPGADAALRAWAGANRKPVRDFAVEEFPDTMVLEVSLCGHGTISVQRRTSAPVAPVQEREGV